MNLTANRSELLGAVNRVRGIVNERLTIPILTHTALVANGVLSLRTSNLDAEAAASVDCETADEGSAVIPVGPLADLLSASTAERVSLSHSGNQVLVSVGAAKLRLPSFPLAEFPVFATADLVSYGEAPAADLLRIIETVEHAAGREATKFLYHTILLCGVGGGLEAHATNGLACSIAFAPGVLEGLPPTIVPYPSIAQLKRALGALGTVQVSASERLLAIEGEGGRFVTKLVEGTYPDLSRVMPPADLTPTATVDADALERALRRCQSVAQDLNRVARLNFKPGALAFTAANFNGLDLADEIEAEFEDEPFSCPAATKQLADAVAAIGSERIELGVAERSFRLRPAGAERPLCLISRIAG